MKSNQTSPLLIARMAGLFELLEALTSGFGQVIVPRMLVVTGDATATAVNVLGHGLLFRLSIVAALIGVMCHVVWVALFYELFKPVRRDLSLMALSFGLVTVAMQGVTIVTQLTPLVVLEAGPSFSTFTIDQVNALAFLFFRINAEAFNLYLAIFGLWCVLIGYLIFRSTFLPRIIGLLEILAGLCWITFIWLPLAHRLSPFNQIMSVIGELSLTFWLLVMGVDGRRWLEKALQTRVVRW